MSARQSANLSAGHLAEELRGLLASGDATRAATLYLQSTRSMRADVMVALGTLQGDMAKAIAAQFGPLPVAMVRPTTAFKSEDLQAELVKMRFQVVKLTSGEIKIPKVREGIESEDMIEGPGGSFYEIIVPDSPKALKDHGAIPPAFRNSVQGGEVNGPVFRALQHAQVTTAGGNPLAAEAYAVLRGAALEYALTNGTMVGALTRLKGVLEVHKVTEATAGVWAGDPKVRALLPMAEFDQPELLSLAYVLEDGSVLPSRFLYVNPHAHSGLPWAQPVLKPESLMVDVAAAMALQLDHEHWVGHFRELAVTQLKRKFEITTRAKVTKKTRVIHVYPSWLMVAPSVYTKILQDSTISFLTDPQASRSLLGFSAMGGDIHRVWIECKKLLATQPVVTLFYSDNLFQVVMGERGVEFRSYDGEKWEGQTHPEDVAKCMRYASRQVFPTTRKQPGVQYFHQITTETACNVPCIIDNVAIEWPGLPSGHPATTLINHVRMANTIALMPAGELTLLPMGAEGSLVTIPGSPARITFEAHSGFEDEYRGHAPGKKAIGKVLRLDLLGFDALKWRYRRRNYRLPVLERTRLLRALVYPKASSKRMDPREEAAIIVVTYLALFYAGGYAYPDITCAVQAYIRDSMPLVATLAVNLSEFTAKLADSQDFGSPELIAVVGHVIDTLVVNGEVRDIQPAQAIEWHLSKILGHAVVIGAEEQQERAAAPPSDEDVAEPLPAPASAFDRRRERDE